MSITLYTFSEFRLWYILFFESVLLLLAIVVSDSLQCLEVFFGLPWWFGGKESTCQCRRHGFSPWVRKIPWRREMATHSSIFAWQILWTEEPAGLQWEYHFLDKLALIFQNKVRYLSLVFSQILNPPELHYTVLIILLFSPISLTNLGRQAFVIGFYDISLAFNLVGTE